MGLDFSYVARGCRNFGETETGPVRWRKNLLATLLVLSSVEKLTARQGQSSPMGEFEQRRMALTGAGGRQCLDEIKAEPDDTHVSECM